MDPQHMMSRLKALASSLNPGQIASLVGAFLLVVGIIVGGAWWVNAPTYALLYSDMDAEGAATLVDRLKSLKVPYKLDEGGRAGHPLYSRSRRRHALANRVTGHRYASAAAD